MGIHDYDHSNALIDTGKLAKEAAKAKLEEDLKHEYILRDSEDVLFVTRGPRG